MANLSLANLTGAILSKADLSGAYLAGGNLSELTLRGANLSETNLTGTSLREANLSGAKLAGADLTDANLTGADFSEADLSEANLSGADLSELNLRGADLSRADMSGADLSGADLIKAILRGTDLAAATLIMANLSESDISGSNLNDANISQWKIKGIKCTHINWKGKKLEFKKGEFEKAFSTIENTIEIILNLPFSEVGYHTGRVIQEVVNNKYGEGAVLFRGHTAISDTDTKFDFISFGTEEQFEEIKAKLDKIPSEIEKRVVKKLEDQKAEDDDRSLIRFKDEFDVPMTKGLVKVSTKELGRRLSERYMVMPPILQKIFMAVQSAIQ